MNEPNRLTNTKEQWAKARRGGEEREVFYEGDDRLPPGQHLVETFPVLDLGFKPDVSLSEWTLTIGGSVAKLTTSLVGSTRTRSGIDAVRYPGSTLHRNSSSLNSALDGRALAKSVRSEATTIAEPLHRLTPSPAAPARPSRPAAPRQPST